MHPFRSICRLPSKLRKKARRSRLALMLILLFIGALLVAPVYAIYKPPSILIRYFQYRWPDVIWKVETAEKLVALTIDDAPSEYTNEILQTLKANDATATLFVIGSQVGGREEALIDLVRNGNELANHAMRDEPSRSLSDDILVEQVEAVGATIRDAYKAVGKDMPPKYFRPGSGFFNTRMRQLLAKLGYQLVLGNVYPHDPQVQYWRINANHILSMVKPGAIIICHDRRSWTIPMLQKVLPELKQRGYRVVTVTELLRAAKT